MKNTVPTQFWIRLAIAAVTIGAAFLLSRMPLIQRFENSAYDLRARLLAKTSEPSPDIVIIGIDEDSLSRLEKRIGRWPWPRSVVGSVIEYCSEASVVMLDIIFAEGHWGYEESDELFVDQVNKHGRVINSIHLNNERTGNEPDELLQKFMLPFGQVNGLPESRRQDYVTAPFANLLRASAGVGHVNYRADPDGVVRSYQVLGQVGVEMYPSLALAGLMTYNNLAPAEIRQSAEGVLALGSAQMHLSPEGTFLMALPTLEYSGYSIADVLGSWSQETRDETPNISRSAFKDKIVIIGSVARGLMDDRRVTSLSPKTPGLIIHAAALDNLMSGIQLRRYGMRVQLCLMILLGIIPTLSHFKRPLLMFALSVVTLIIFLLISLLALFGWLYMIPIISPMLSLVLTSGVLGTLYWYAERDQRRYLETLEKAKQEFTDMLVHDMKNALVPVVMSLEIANEAPQKMRPSQLHEFITTVDSSSRRLLSQINNLLDIRKMAEGKLHLVPQLMQPEGVLRDAVNTYQNTARFSGQKLVYRAGEGADREVILDAHILERVMENLIWNAIKYGREDQEVEVACATEDSQFCISVANHGAPIPKEQQSYMFASFVSGALHEAKQMVPSTGLGLAFCKLAVEEQGGQIRLESPWPGHEDGVKITLTFPV